VRLKEGGFFEALRTKLSWGERWAGQTWNSVERAGSNCRFFGRLNITPWTKTC